MEVEEVNNGSPSLGGILNSHFREGGRSHESVGAKVNNNVMEEEVLT